jgi:RNA polymerase sigma-70 factor (ECF subfamily)
MAMKQILYERLIQYILEHQDRFYRVAYSYTRHQEDALDAVQSAVCKALEAHENIKNADAIKTWFYKILINECLTVLKKRGKVVLIADAAKQEEAYYEKGYEQGGDIERELEKLEMDVQVIIKLRFFEEMSLKEISGITGLNLNTVKTKLYRGLKLLKENIQEADLWAD